MGLKMVVIGDWSEFISFLKSYLGSSPWSIKGLKLIATTCVVVSFLWGPRVTYFILETLSPQLCIPEMRVLYASCLVRGLYVITCLFV